MRQRKLYHQLWTHLPTAALLGYIIYRFVVAMPLPAGVPLHFNAAGNPNRWGSPWELFAVFVGLGLLYLGISILVDELWARQETRKTFNWLSLFDEAIIAIFAATIAGYGDFRHAVTVPGWSTIAVWIAASALNTTIMEWQRRMSKELCYNAGQSSREAETVQFCGNCNRTSENRDCPRASAGWTVPAFATAASITWQPRKGSLSR